MCTFVVSPKQSALDNKQMSTSISVLHNLDEQSENKNNFEKSFVNYMQKINLFL
jgi:hypothetical protein